MTLRELCYLLFSTVECISSTFFICKALLITIGLPLKTNYLKLTTYHFSYQLSIFIPVMITRFNT